jgi:hypothetical protein
MDEYLRKSREPGFLEHLVKPVKVPELEAAIHRTAGVGVKEMQGNAGLQ